MCSFSATVPRPPWVCDEYVYNSLPLLPEKVVSTYTSNFPIYSRKKKHFVELPLILWRAVPYKNILPVGRGVMTPSSYFMSFSWDSESHYQDACEILLSLWASFNQLLVKKKTWPGQVRELWRHKMNNLQPILRLLAKIVFNNFACCHCHCCHCFNPFKTILKPKKNFYFFILYRCHIALIVVAPLCSNHHFISLSCMQNILIKKQFII